MSRLSVAIAVVSLVSCSIPRGGARPAPSSRTATAAQPVVYGGDDRNEYYALSDPAVAELGRASVAALTWFGSVVEEGDGTIRLNVPTLGLSANLCAGERFYDQPRAAACSATLIDDDIVVTAGHCVEGPDDCALIQVVFDYRMIGSDAVETIVAADDVYACAEVVARFDDEAIDYAVIRLDRPVTGGHRPALVERRLAAIDIGTPLVMVGFPSGVPMKFDAGGEVRSGRAFDLDYFRANLDAFSGSSGAGVFDDTLRLRGILARGATDYVDEGDCKRVRVLPDALDGEQIVYVAHAIRALCAADPAAGPCRLHPDDCTPCVSDGDCGERGLCRDGGAGARCVRGCGADDGCAAGWTCGDDGACAPGLRTICRGDAVVVDACGATVATADACGAGEECMAGVCVPVPAGGSCAAPDRLVAPAAVIDTIGAAFSDRGRATCGGVGPDRVYAVDASDEARLRIALDAPSGHVYVRQDCASAETELACSPLAGRTTVEAEVPAGTSYVFVDSVPVDEPFTLTVELLPICRCVEGVTRCAGARRERCVATAGPCPIWAPEACDDETTCVDGACVTPAPFDACATAAPIAWDTPGAGAIEANHANDATASCGADGGDQVWTFALPEPSIISLAAPGFGGTIHVREACDDPRTELACAAADPGVETILPEGTFFAFVEGPFGPYTLESSAQRACTDGCTADRETQCLAAGSWRACGLFDGDSCLEWGPETACAEGTACHDGECVPSSAEPTPDAGADVGADAGDDLEQDPGSPRRKSGCAAAVPAAPSCLVLVGLVALVVRPRRR